jgi:putative DNA primase/helicase
MFASARLLSEQGLPVFPVFGLQEDLSCACGNPECGSNAGKHPQTTTGFKAGTTEQGTVKHWFQNEYPGANVGVVCGEPSGIIVLDIDGATGRESLNGYDLPDTLTVSTGRNDGGRHYWFKYPGASIRNAVGLLPGVDVRGTGGYVLAPPSRHRSGTSYQWGDPDGFDWEKLVAPPEWLLQLIEEKLAERGPHLGFQTTIASGLRNETIFKECCRLRATGADFNTLYAFAKGRNAQCQEPLSEQELQKLAESASHYEPNPELQTYRHTDEGNADRFVLSHGDEIRYYSNQKAWLVWDGKRWCDDKRGRVRQLAASTVKETFNLAVQKGDQKLEGWTASTEKHHGIRRMIEATESRAGISVTTEELDRYPMLLNVQTGTINLETGDELPHDPKYMLTKMAPVDFDRLATAPRWLTFLDEVFNKDEDLIRFVQKAIGYSMTGSVAEQVVFICYGLGENGKSSFLNAIRGLLGDYAKNTPFSSFEADAHQGAASHDLASLHGARFVTAIESEQDKRLAEARVKAVTGGDPVTCRFLYKDFFTYTPEWAVFFAVNHKPEVRGVDRAIWRRIRLIPFTQSYPKGDKTLAGRLKAESSGILNWALEGLRLYLAEGLEPPAIVRQAVQEYREEMDILGEFISEEAVLAKDASVMVSPFYSAYVDFSVRRGEKPMTMNRFSRQLVERGFTKEATRKGKQFIGIGLEPLRMNSNRGN